MSAIVWTDELTEAVTAMWREGKSGGEIAKALTNVTKTRFTRNQVIGKVHRLQKHGILEQRAPVGHGQRPRVGKAPSATTKRNTPNRSGITVRKKSQPMKPHAGDATTGFGPDGGVALMDLKDHHCRFSFKAGAFCGAQRKEKSSYCERHHLVCYDLAATKRVRAKKRKPSDATNIERVNRAVQKVFGG